MSMRMNPWTPVNYLRETQEAANFYTCSCKTHFIEVTNTAIVELSMFIQESTTQYSVNNNLKPYLSLSQVPLVNRHY